VQTQRDIEPRWKKRYGGSIPCSFHVSHKANGKADPFKKIEPGKRKALCRRNKTHKYSINEAGASALRNPIKTERGLTTQTYSWSKAKASKANTAELVSSRRTNK